jgi:hypothetical protein
VQVRLASPRLLSDGRFAFQIQGSAGARYQLEASSDLTHWDVIRTGTLSSEDEEVVDEIGTNDRRFYRVR